MRKLYLQTEAPNIGACSHLSSNRKHGSVADLPFGGKIRKPGIGRSRTCESQLSCFRKCVTEPKNLRQNPGDRAPSECPCVAAGTLALTAVQGAESLSHCASLTGLMGAGGFEETHRFHTDAPGISSLAFYIQSYREILLAIYCLLKHSNGKYRVFPET